MDIVEQWIMALRSGQYKQGKHRLRNDRDEFCCLGVLADISNCAEWVSHEVRGPMCQFDNESTALESTWPGDLIEKVTGMDKKFLYSLMGENDSGRTFEEIADFIKAERDR